MRALCTIRRSNQELDHPKKISRVATHYFPRNLPFHRYRERYRIMLAFRKELRRIRERARIVPRSICSVGAQVKDRYIFPRISNICKYEHTISWWPRKGKANSVKISF